MTQVVNDWHDGLNFTGASTSFVFTLLGGKYAFSVASAAWGGGSAVLNQLQIDGSTYIAASSVFIANGSQLVDLPAGTYQIAITTATGVLGSLVLVPHRAP